MADIGEEDASYKRGLVLGLTMAEIMILILFILLLLLATLVRDLEEKLDAFVRENAGLQNELVALGRWSCWLVLEAGSTGRIGLGRLAKRRLKPPW